MNNELNVHKKSDAVKWFAIFLIVILLSVAVIALCAKVFNVACLINHDYDEAGVCVRCGDVLSADDAEQNADGNGGMEIDEENNTDQGIALLVADIPVELYSEYDIAPIAESAKQITAAILPAYASNQKVDWSVAWKNASSEWATDKKEEDFVLLDSTEDGALTVTVSCLQAFGEQMIITVTSRDNPDAFATCTVDYKQKILSLSLTLSPIYDNAVQGSILVYYDSDSAPVRTISHSVSLSETYTIPCEDTTVKVSYRLASGVYTGGVCDLSQEECQEGRCSHYYSKYNLDWIDFTSDTVKFDRNWVYTMLEAKYPAGVNALKTILQRAHAFDIRISCGNVEKIFELSGNTEYWTIAVEDVMISESSFVFE